MNQKQKIYNIAVLEDSEFYNSLLTRELESYCSALALEMPFDFRIYSYTSADQFTRKTPAEWDLVFMDFYLDNQKNGADVTQELLKQNEDCTVVMLSQSNSIKISTKARTSGVRDFIHKDNDSFNKVYLAVKNFFAEKLGVKS